MAWAFQAQRPCSAIGLTRPRLQQARRARHVQVCSSLQDPWTTLGVPKTATEKEIKKAHRKLVLQTHPDLKGGDDPVAQVRFMRIQEAYELIMGKRAGKDVDSRPADKSGWQFHDWYWKFSMKRRKGKGPFAAAAAADEAPPPGAFRQQWQAQMAGLKQKAAAKRSRWQQRTPHAAGAAAEGTAREAGGAPGGPTGSAAARESVWRSMTKNARHSDKAAQQAGQAADRLAAEPSKAAQAVAAASSQPLQHHQQAPKVQPASPAHEAPREAGSGMPPQQHVAAAGAGQHTEQVHEHPAAAHHTAAEGHPAGSSHIDRLRQLLEHAATLVHPGPPQQQQHHHAAPSQHHMGSQQHAEPAAASAGGRHTRGFMSLEHIVALLSGQRQRSPQHAAPTAAEGLSSAIPADQHLHHHLEARLRHHRRQQQQQQHKDAQQPGAAGAWSTADDAAAQERQAELEEHRRRQAAHHSAHSFKFANRDEVEGRLSSQLAGLKRRAALKQEVESSC